MRFFIFIIIGEITDAASAVAQLSSHTVASFRRNTAPLC